MTGTNATIHQNPMSIYVPMDSESPIHKWLIGNKVVSLLSKENNLECEILDRITAQQYRIPINIDNRPINEQVNCLFECIPEIKSDKTITFARPKSCIIWPEHNISLIQWQNNLIWQLFDKTRKTTSWLPAEHDFGCYGLYRQKLALLDEKNLENIPIDPPNSKALIRQLFRKYIPANLRTSLYEGFRIVSIKAHNDQLSDVYLEVISSKSLLDSAKIYNRDVWALTLICAGSSWYGHAVIVIEGVEKGHAFLRNAHLVAVKAEHKCILSLNTIPAVVEIFDNVMLKYSGKTETWLVEREKAERMLSSINNEISEQKEGHSIAFFNYLGSDAILTQAKQLKHLSDLEVKDEASQGEEGKFKSTKVLYALPNSSMFLPLPRIFDFNGLIRLTGLFVLPSLPAIMLFPKLRNTFDKFLPSADESNDKPDHSTLISLAGRLTTNIAFAVIICYTKSYILNKINLDLLLRLKKKVIYQLTRGGEQKIANKFRNFIFYNGERINDAVPIEEDYELYTLPENCVTWARKKLALANIILLPSKYRHIFDIPKQYTQSIHPKKDA